MNTLFVQHLKRISGVWLCAAIAVPFFLSAFPFFDETPAGMRELKQGDVASARGDVINAEKFYRKALDRSGNDIALWSACTSRLGTLALQSGNVEKAKTLLGDFHKKFPAGSAGTLPGEIMAAENDFAGAEKFFRSLIARHDIYADQAKFMLAEMRMKQKRYSDALDIYSSLRDSQTALTARRAEYGKILALIELGRINEAETLLEKGAESGDINFSKFKLYAAVRKNDLEYLRKHKDVPEQLRKSDEFLCRVFMRGADAAARKDDHRLAASLLESAFVCASEYGVKREIISRLFSECACYDAALAAKVAERYAELFPQSSDRALMLMQTGRLLNANKMYKEAVRFYLMVAKDRENLLVERYSAALEGAGAAELGGLYQETEDFYNRLLELAPTSERQDDARLEQALYFLRRNKYLEAEKILLQLAERGIHTNCGESAAFRLLQSKSKRNALAEGDLKFALQLEKSGNALHAEFGTFTVAEIMRQNSVDYQKARNRYLEFVRKYPSSIFVPQARFSAAYLAEKMKDFSVSAKEFASFADDLPEHVNAGAARFLAVKGFCRAGLAKEAANELEQLRKDSRDLNALASGILTLAEYLMNNGGADEVLKMFERMCKDNDLLRKRADMRFLAGRILSKLKDYRGALNEFDALLKDNPELPVAAEANFLAGNLRFDVFNDFAGAGKNFRESLRLNSGGVFGSAVSGRLADCCYMMYLQSNDIKLLEEAELIYRRIAENAPLSGIRLQAAYKAGRCREASGDMAKALEDFEHTLYLGVAIRESGLRPEQTWCERAAYAAVRLALSEEGVLDTAKAQQLLALYRELGFENSKRDFESLRRQIRERQNFLKRGTR